MEKHSLWNDRNTMLIDDTREKKFDVHSCNVVHLTLIACEMKVINDDNKKLQQKILTIVDMDQENQ